MKEPHYTYTLKTQVLQEQWQLIFVPLMTFDPAVKTGYNTDSHILNRTSDF